MSNLRTYRGIAPTLGARVYVDPAATVIGAVELADDVSIWPGAVLRGDVHHIRIGARSNVQDGTIVHVTHDGPYSPGGFPTLVEGQEEDEAPTPALVALESLLLREVPE